ncbi:MAG: M28 family peptidase [Flavobacteriales bacterium]|nr:M28 family peptidase [Flavobacteriales bacterium]
MLAGRELTDALLVSAGTNTKKALRKGRKARYSTTTSAEITFRATPLTSRVVSENVLGFIEGSDKKEEVVVVTAHYDHIGKDAEEVYNGADDDGSGTVALLEMAEAFSRAKAEGHGPRRSVLFMPVSAEEKGLLGSEYYSEHPVFPLEHTVADLNIDMIGRRDSAHAVGAPYVYVIGSDRLSTELHAINEEANAKYVSLDLDYTFNAPDDPNRFYYRSDHYNFARKGVPAIFYFSGVHEDYHGPGDEVEKILPDLLEQRARLVFYTAWELANREQRIVVDRPEGSK